MFPFFSTASIQLGEGTTAKRCKLAPSNNVSVDTHQVLSQSWSTITEGKERTLNERNLSLSSCCYLNSVKHKLHGTLHAEYTQRKPEVTFNA